MRSVQEFIAAWSVDFFVMHDALRKQLEVMIATASNYAHLGIAYEYQIAKRVSPPFDDLKSYDLDFMDYISGWMTYSEKLVEMLRAMTAEEYRNPLFKKRNEEKNNEKTQNESES